MCFPDINMVLCLKVSSTISVSKEQQSFSWFFFCCSFTLRTVGHYSASTGTCQAAAGGSLAAEDLCFLLGNDARRALLQMLLRYEWREGGQGQGNGQCARQRYADSPDKSREKTSHFPGSILNYFKNKR